ncbi:MAG: ATP-binding protein [Actinomycetota bacterium]|nr:ATP-binding protein [Actinomycetota bacterium]
MTTFAHIYERIESKKADYASYNFSHKENNALKTFFDLAQEFDDLTDFYKLCVAIPKAFFDLDARLYMLGAREGMLVLAAQTESGALPLRTPLPEDIKPASQPYYTEKGGLVLTIHGKEILSAQLPFKAEDNVLGILEVYPTWNLSDHQALFFQKYANRVGFNLHNRFITQKNIEHLRFIRGLVSDIEHNIIVPNMVYKLFLRNLKAKISDSLKLEEMIKECLASGQCQAPTMSEFLAAISEVNRGISAEFENIEKHYTNMTLFLETLFRRSHFDKGRLTLRTKACNMKKDIVAPQLERYAGRFRDTGIEIDDRLSGIPDEEIITVVDLGLMAQVYANLFSNALKFTREITDDYGHTRKYISYGHEVFKDYFGPGKDGIKYNVFNTGPHIPEGERGKLFEDGYRGSNAPDIPGTGHGLAFFKNVIELHGGVAGYEATKNGNNFYFILPR